MSRPAIKTDHSNLEMKVKLRLDNVPEACSISVLDCFHGEGRIWNAIKSKRPGQNICVLGIDQKRGTDGLIGKNQKFLANMRLDEFDIIDLDAYGFPIEQLEIIKDKLNPKQTIFATFCTKSYGGPPNIMLYRLGYTESMLKKCTMIFRRNLLVKILNYLWLYGARKASYYCDVHGTKQRYYFCFRQTERPKF